MPCSTRCCFKWSRNWLIRYALCCNGYDVSIKSNAWDNTLAGVIKEFQNDLKIPVTGKCDLNTWMSLFLSKGNPDRSSIACDTRFEITQARLDYLKNNGYKIVGRYISYGILEGENKKLKQDEFERILANGLSVAPIFQQAGNDTEYFTEAQGGIDAKKASENAKSYGIPKGSIIYFAVDYDPQDLDIKNKILPYFKALSNSMGVYKIGVYGTRNVCTQVSNAGYAVSSYVSDMSTGFSGNMGYKMPSNWNFDQFHEFKVTSVSMDLDKVAYSGRYPAVSSLDPTIAEEKSNKNEQGTL